MQVSIIIIIVIIITIIIIIIIILFFPRNGYMKQINKTGKQDKKATIISWPT